VRDTREVAGVPARQGTSALRSHPWHAGSGPGKTLRPQRAFFGLCTRIVESPKAMQSLRQSGNFTCIYGQNNLSLLAGEPDQRISRLIYLGAVVNNGDFSPIRLSGPIDGTVKDQSPKLSVIDGAKSIVVAL
jgi:hypothetical protein